MPGTHIRRLFRHEWFEYAFECRRYGRIFELYREPRTDSPQMSICDRLLSRRFGSTMPFFVKRQDVCGKSDLGARGNATFRRMRCESQCERVLDMEERTAGTAQAVCSFLFLAIARVVLVAFLVQFGARPTGPVRAVDGRSALRTGWTTSTSRDGAPSCTDIR